MQLNTDQQKAIEQMTLFMDNFLNNQSFFILSGYAGTGKTTVIQHFIDTLEPTQIAMTAPTNKAVKVMERMATPSSKHEIEYLTIYKILDLTMGFEDDEKIIIPREGNKNTIKNFKLIIIDEGSMISSKLFELLVEIVKKYRIKIIILGDPAQLPPVNEEISPVFLNEYQFPSMSLTKVMRVENGNPLLLTVDKVRERVLSPEFWIDHIELHNSFTDDRSMGYFQLSRERWLATMVTAFNSKEWKDNPDFVRAIAWTNRAVDNLNNFIRNNIYDDARVPYLEGERLIAKDSIFAQGSDIVLINNSSEMEIIWAEPGTDKKYGFNTWVMLVKAEDGLRHQLTVLDKNDTETMRKYNGILAEFADNARNETVSYLRKSAWGKFWSLKEKTYASVNYAYALTSHKAQGSTFNHVFVEQSDILKNTNHKERYQSLYVAYSRASHRVMVVC